MVDDSVSKYADAKSRYKRAKEELQAIGELLNKVGVEIQRDPGSVGFSNTGVAGPAGTIAKTYNGDKWPSAKQIMELNSEMNKAKHEAVNCWHSLPQNLRDTLVPPDQF